MVEKVDSQYKKHHKSMLNMLNSFEFKWKEPAQNHPQESASTEEPKQQFSSFMLSFMNEEKEKEKR